jgi:hypothetical protein
VQKEGETWDMRGEKGPWEDERQIERFAFWTTSIR